MRMGANNPAGQRIWAETLIPWFRDQYVKSTGTLPPKIEVTIVTGLFARPGVWGTIAGKNPTMPMTFRAEYLISLDKNGTVDRVQYAPKISPASMTLTFPEGHLLDIGNRATP